MEHRLIQGGEPYLPFARSRIKALRALGLPYADQSFEMPDGSVKVRIEPGHEYISLSGKGGLVCALANIEYPTVVTEVAGQEIPRYSVVGSQAKLRSGSHANTGETWGVSPYSEKHISAKRITGAANDRMDFHLYIDDVQVLTSSGAFSSTSSGTYASGSSSTHTLGNYVYKGTTASDLAVILRAVSDGTVAEAWGGAPPAHFIEGLTTKSPAWSLASRTTTTTNVWAAHVYLADYVYDTSGAKTLKSNGGVALTYQDIAFPAPTITSTSSTSNTYSVTNGGTITQTQSASQSVNSDVFEHDMAVGNFATDASGNVYVLNMETHTSVAGSAYETYNYGTGAYTVGGTSVTTITTSAQVSKATRGSPTYTTDDRAYARTESYTRTVVSAYVNGTTEGVNGSTTTTLAGLRIVPMKVFAGKGPLCVLYQSYPMPGATPSIKLDVVDPATFALIRTLDLGTDDTVLDGASAVYGNHLWGNKVHLNLTTGVRTPIPSFLPARSGVDVDANYHEFSSNGSRATYYWLNLSAGNRALITSGSAPIYPSAGGHFRAYRLSTDSAGTQTISDVTTADQAIYPVANLAAVDTNGASLIFKK